LKNTKLNTLGDANGWFGDTANVQFYEQQYKDALRDEASNIMFHSPNATSSEVMTNAKSNLAARSIATDIGPIFLPRGSSVEKVFGVPAGLQSRIAPALNELFKPTKDGSMFRLSVSEGRLLAYQYDRQGNPIGGDVVDMQAVREVIKKQSDVEQVAAEQRHGGGKRVVKDGVELRFNGLNTAGVPADWTFGLRNNLLQNEGLTRKEYKDLSGKLGDDGRPIMTNGIGVSSHNKWYPKPDKDGNITDEQVRHSFAGASNDAAVAGATVARQNGLYNRSGFMLMSELAYQSGTAFLSQSNSVGDEYRAFVKAMQSKDVDAAKDAFKKTAAYRFSALKGKGETARQRNYLKLIEETMKGN
jgi:hypothetical protein